MVRFKNVLLGLGIVIVFALLLWQGIEAFYPSPSYNSYCGNVTGPVAQPVINKTMETQAYCVSHNGTWQNGYCNYYAKCQAEYDAASQNHAQIVFFISLIVGVIAIAIGYLILSVEPVGSALIGSGIWAFFYGGVVNWRNFSDIWRFLLLLIVFIVLVWFALRLNRASSGKQSKKKRWWDWK